jgi:biopolymer transport protein ExbD
MKRMDQINVIPFIDIMLVLLTIVLTTATFIAEGRLQIRLPQAAAKPQMVPERPLEIAVDAGGSLYLNAEPLGTGTGALTALDEGLTGLSPETPVVLRVDAAARFEQFVAVMDRLKARGLERLHILTRRP